MRPSDLHPCCRSIVVRVEGKVIIGSHMPRQYSSSVRRQIVSRLRSGEPVAAVAAETGVCQATLFRWKRQALIDAGVIEGIPSVVSRDQRIHRLTEPFSRQSLRSSIPALWRVNACYTQDPGQPKTNCGNALRVTGSLV
jgi:transposase-like protein